MPKFQVSQFHVSKKFQFQVSKIPSVHSKGRSLAENQENENNKKRLDEDFFEFEKSKVSHFLKPKRSSFRKKKNK